MYFKYCNTNTISCNLFVDATACEKHQVRNNGTYTYSKTFNKKYETNKKKQVMQIVTQVSTVKSFVNIPFSWLLIKISICLLKTNLYTHRLVLEVFYKILKELRDVDRAETSKRKFWFLFCE